MKPNEQPQLRITSCTRLGPDWDGYYRVGHKPAGIKARFSQRYPDWQVRPPRTESLRRGQRVPNPLPQAISEMEMALEYAIRDLAYSQVRLAEPSIKLENGRCTLIVEYASHPLLRKKMDDMLVGRLDGKGYTLSLINRNEQSACFIIQSDTRVAVMIRAYGVLLDAVHPQQPGAGQAGQMRFILQSHLEAMARAGIMAEELELERRDGSRAIKLKLKTPGRVASNELTDWDTPDGHRTPVGEFMASLKEIGFYVIPKTEFDYGGWVLRIRPENGNLEEVFGMLQELVQAHQRTVMIP